MRREGVDNNSAFDIGGRIVENAWATTDDHPIFKRVHIRLS